MKKSKLSVAALILAFACLAGSCAGTTPQTRNPDKTGDGASAEQVTPETSGSQGSDSGSSDSSSSGSNWQPGIFDYDQDIPIGGNYDFSTVYDYTGATLTAASGNMTAIAGVYEATSGAAIYANRNTSTPFPYGTYSADVINKGTDTGIIFGLTASASTFWEGAGISYYFFFVSMSGSAYLGKTDNGAWSALVTPSISGWSATTKYNVKVIFKGNKILGFIDGKHMLTYTDASPLTGTGWGIRAGGTGATIENLQITSSFDA